MAALAAAVLASACDSHEPDAADVGAAPTPAQVPDTGGGQAVQQSPASRLDAAASASSDTGSGSLLRDAGASVESIAERLSHERYGQLLAIDHLLSRGEIREVTGFTGTLARSPLEGQEPNETYNAFRLAADTSFGFGLQVWKFRDTAQATTYFNRLQETYVVVGNTRVGEATAFRAELGGIREIVFLSEGQAEVVSLSCDDQVCTTEAPLMSLAERVFSRL